MDELYTKIINREKFMEKLDLTFLKTFNKELEKMVGVSTSDEPPKYSFHTGNYVLNKITSGSFYKGGIACQGRVGILAGPSGSGKSFLLCNLMREAQKEGAYILALDSENALSCDFVRAIGVDPDNDYSYVGVVTIPQVVHIVSYFLKQYKSQYPDLTTAPKILIVIDSLDMLLTQSEFDNYAKGEQKGDMGGKNKALKAFLKTVVQDIKTLNVTVVATAQVYASQDPFSADGKWVISDGIKYSASTITLLNRLKLRDTSGISGIKMDCEGFKVRYTKPFQKVRIEVPYEEGMNPYSGLADVLTGLNVITKNGAWYTTSDGQKFQEKNIDKYADSLLLQAEQITNAFIKTSVEDPIDEVIENEQLIE
ncbi:MAG: hypothetical protein ACXW2E_00240 [Nitrososphaeraceae archaeon]